MSFEVTILGNSSASPTHSRHPSSQYVNICDHHLLIDCGEGTQMQLARYKIKKSKISQIFISHVHGDHILGLPGLLLSMNLMKREQPIHIFGPPELFKILDVFFKYSDTQFCFETHYHIVDPNKRSVVFENLFYKVIAFPLFHRVPTTGFLIEERSKLKKLNMEVCERLKIPFTFYNDIKMGKDYCTPEGKWIKNEELTFPAALPISYAYCSDTLFDERVIDAVRDADILYHEATFMHDRLDRAVYTMHTTAKQAGIVARQAGAKKLIVGHFSARYDDLEPILLEARSEFPNTEIAQEGKTFILE
ncbi:MAG: ribonuclease Z [Bacteroidetes bacterium]|nr:ribonuclease Z [Bacteroidota bacterium]MCK6612227.1 ribonuclease Z [Bacteroidia bacterium]